MASADDTVAAPAAEAGQPTATAAAAVTTPERQAAATSATASKQDKMGGKDDEDEHAESDEGEEEEEEEEENEEEEEEEEETTEAGRSKAEVLYVRGRRYKRSTLLRNWGLAIADDMLRQGKPNAVPALCTLRAPHNVLRCAALHLSQGAVLIGDRYVRLNMLLDNPARVALLTKPAQALRMQFCEDGHPGIEAAAARRPGPERGAQPPSAAEAEPHNAEQCSKLHLLPGIVFVGVPGLRTAYFESELCDNLALTTLKAQPWETQCGTWCRSHRSHVVTTCNYIHYRRRVRYTERPRPPDPPLPLIPDLTPRDPQQQQQQQLYRRGRGRGGRGGRGGGGRGRATSRGGRGGRGRGSPRHATPNATATTAAAPVRRPVAGRGTDARPQREGGDGNAVAEQQETTQRAEVVTEHVPQPPSPPPLLQDEEEKTSSERVTSSSDEESDADDDVSPGSGAVPHAPSPLPLAPTQKAYDSNTRLALLLGLLVAIAAVLAAVLWHTA